MRKRSGMFWTIPPIAKVYEALSAVGDGRVSIQGMSATVFSSDRSKTYTVRWSEDRSAFSSNDNGTYWQGYLGYPILAVCMLLGILKYDPETAKTFAGIEWKKLNDKHKHDYAAGITQVLLGLQDQGIDASKIQTEVETVYAQVQKLTLNRLPSSDRPPK